MSSSSSKSSSLPPQIIDASGLINLRASTHGERILSVIPNEIMVAKTVEGELNKPTSYASGDQVFLERLVDLRIVTITDLTDDEFELFEKLISDIDDGEAATIAIAAMRKFLAVIDDKKGRAQAVIHLKADPAWTLDLLRHPAVLTELGDADAIEALYLALRDGRMRIPLDRADEVIALIGEDLARECKCLPNYKARFGPRKS